MPDSYGSSFTGVGRNGLTACESATIPTAFAMETPSRIRIGRYNSVMARAPLVNSFTCPGSGNLPRRRPACQAGAPRLAQGVRASTFAADFHPNGEGHVDPERPLDPPH